jgi:hypothetical protein
LFGIRADAIKKLRIKDCTFKNLSNTGSLGNTHLGGNYLLSHDSQKIPGYHGSDCTGINISACDDVEIKRVKMENLNSANGEVRGVRIVNECSSVIISNIDCDGVNAGTKIKDKYLGESFDGDYVDYSHEYPNRLPLSIGIKEEDKTNGIYIDLYSVNIKSLTSVQTPVPIWKQ